jgi:hypothetical protein
VAVLLLALLACSTAQRTFLGTELPLTVTVTTPYELSDGSTGSLPITGRQAITVSSSWLQDCPPGSARKRVCHYTQ